MNSEQPTNLPPTGKDDAPVPEGNRKKEQFGFGFYMTLGLLLLIWSFSEPTGPPAGNSLINAVAGFSGLQAYLLHGSLLQRISSLLLFAVGLGLLLSPALATIYVGWTRR